MQFDLVVGNPPYVRIHNTQENLKTFAFCQRGMSDLYIAFYEIGLQILKPTGKLCYINPSSMLQSQAASKLRTYITEKQMLVKVFNWQHKQIFSGKTTYSTIVLLNYQHRQATTEYHIENLKPVQLSAADFVINGCWYFDCDNLELL